MLMKKSCKPGIVACCLAFAILARAALVADTRDASIHLPPRDQVVSFLLQSVDWYRHGYSERQVATDPADLLFLDENQPMAAQIARLSFEFARHEAVLVDNEDGGASGQAGSSSPDLGRMLALKEQATAALQKTTQDIDALQKRLPTARPAEKRKLEAQLEGAESRTKLLQEGSSRLDDLINFMQGVGAGAQAPNLASAIENLAQTVPDVGATNPLPTAPSQDSSSRLATSSHGGGLLSLAAEVSGINHKLRIINEKLTLTDNLLLSAQRVRAPMADVMNAVQNGALGSLNADDAGTLIQQKAKLDAFTAELRAISPALMALDKQKILLTAYRSHLADWRSTVAGEYKRAWKNLMLRGAIVLLIIGVVIVIGETSRRVTVNRIHDPNRRRAVAVGSSLFTLLAVLVVAAFGFASDLGALATYFGLITAGVAVALQNVIVASAGYLMLVGKRGIRIGDRVKFSGITGDITEIGLLQFQVREFDVGKQQYTGQVATFSNSFVFLSPTTGLFKADPDFPVPRAARPSAPACDEHEPGSAVGTKA